MRITMSAAAAFAAMTLAGCGGGSPTGTRTTTGPGVVEYDVYPTDVLVVEPGKSKDVKVTRKGGDMKEHALTVTSSDPAVHVEGGKFVGEGKEATITVKADPNAPAKEHTITIKSGDVTKLVKVKVEPAGAGGTSGTTGGTSGTTGGTTGGTTTNKGTTTATARSKTQSTK